VFHVSFFALNQLVALAILVPASAAAAAGLGLIVSIPCSTRRQQATVATITVLLLSALGGSMVPSFMLPEYMQEAGAFVFNWWAIDAFQQVLWYSSAEEGIPVVLGRIDIALVFLAGTAVAGLVFARAVFSTRA